VMMQALHDYMFNLAKQRREQPGDDFTSIAGTLLVEGEKLDDRDLGWWCFSFVAAGLESTRNAMSVGLLELMRHPEQAHRLRVDHTLAPLAAEEIVRWVTPSRHKFRIATRDVELGDKMIRRGDWVMCWLVSANRDETVFERPDAFDIARKPNPHLAYGAGEHGCIGRYLAQLEIQTMICAVLDRLPDMQVAGPCDWVVSDNHTGLKHLPVQFTPARSAAV
jgi:cytochrome P450